MQMHTFPEISAMKLFSLALAFALVLGLAGTAAAADLSVVATIPNLGMLVREIGGDAVTVRVLAPPNRDAHYLEAVPSMMAALRRADLVVSIGADLEVGWLPAALTGANNRRVMPGQPGNFVAADQVKLLDDDKPADRALGDVHPHGNPHVDFDPERLAAIGRALARRMGELAPAQATEFAKRAETLAEALAEHGARWKERVNDAPGVLSYHSDHMYLLRFLGVKELGTIEPLPGIPPTAAHLRGLVRRLREEPPGVIWTSNYQPDRAARFMARELGWPSHQLPTQVPMDGGFDAYVAMVEAWLDTLDPP